MRVGVMSATRTGRTNLGLGRGARELGELRGAVVVELLSIVELVSFPEGGGSVRGLRRAVGSTRG